MPKRIRVREIPSPELQGEDSWVKVKAPTMAEFNQIQSLPAQMQELAATEGVAADVIKKMAKEYEELIAQFILEWNWVDDDDKPLPQPHNNPEIFDQLTAPEVMWLGGVLNPQNDVWQKKT